METERKYRDINLRAIYDRLERLGFKSLGLHFESNLVFDTPDLELSRSGRLLRIRTSEWPARTRHFLTYKGPADNNAAARDNVKAREEIELEIRDGAPLALILTNLGYRQIGRYEKFRESWQLPQLPGLSVDMDRLPFGDFMEIEGSPAEIERVEQALGLDKSKISLKTYHELNQEWRKMNGLTPARDFLFEPQRKARLRASCGLS